MKINSVLGKMNGKVGNIVTASVGGAVIGREYNPNVANPNTGAQQQTRAKFKLCSQLAAALSPVIAIKKDGLKSARNIFTSINFDSVRYAQSQADINLNIVQLTNSKKAFVGFKANRTAGTGIAVELNAAAPALSRVVYIAYEKMADGSLNLIDSQVVSTPGADNKFAGSLAQNAGAVVCYAYGITDLDAAMTIKFGNMQAQTAQDIATLLVSSSDNMSGVSLTKTAGLTMAEGTNTGDSDDVEHMTVSLVISGNGTATGGGRFLAGQTCTLIATPTEGATFVAWKAGSASGQVLSTSAQYSFEVEANVTICAVFQGGPTPHYTVAASANPVAGGSVSGAGSFEEGQSCTLVATPSAGYQFVNWTENGQQVSTLESYQFSVMSARTLVAHFEEIPPIPTHTVTAACSPAAAGSVSGTGTYPEGSEQTLVVHLNNGYSFLRWEENGQTIGTSPSLHITVNADRNITAVCQLTPAATFSNVTVNGSAFSANKQVSQAAAALAGSVTSGVSTSIGLIPETANPQIGRPVSVNKELPLSGGSFSGNLTLDQEVVYKLIAFHFDGDSSYICDGIFDYTLQYHVSDPN